MRRRFVLIAPAVALTQCLFPSLDGLSSGDASIVETGADTSDQFVPPDVSVDVGVDASTLGTYVEEVTADSPASWWRLGESSTSSPAADEMGVQTGTYHTPGTTLGVVGAIGKDTNTAATFDGTSGAMYLPGTLFNLGGSPPFAIEVWVSPGPPPPADASDPLRRIVSHRTTSPYFGWFMAIDASQRILFTRWDSNATVASVTSTPLAQGQWSHVVVSADGTTLTLYVNGASVASGAEATITDTPATHVSFGSTSDFTGEWFDGALDEPAIYAHALAPARVLAHYQAGIAK